MASTAKSCLTAAPTPHTHAPTHPCTHAPPPTHTPHAHHTRRPVHCVPACLCAGGCGLTIRRPSCGWLRTVGVATPHLPLGASGAHTKATRALPCAGAMAAPHTIRTSPHIPLLAVPHPSPLRPAHLSPALAQPQPRGEMMQFFFPQMIDQDSNPLVPMLASVGTQVV